MRRVPIDSAAPIAVFAVARLVVSIVALAAVAILGFPYDGRAALVLGVFTLWSAAVLALARREPELALHPAVPAVDFALLLALELVAPDTLVGVQLAALFLVAAHAHFQGERRGVMIGVLGAAALVGGVAIRGDAPVRHGPGHLLRDRLLPVRARHLGRGGHAAHVGVGVAPPSARAVAAHDAGRE